MSSERALPGWRARLRGAWALALILILATAASAATPAPWFSKVAPEVLASAAGGDVAFLVVLTSQADLDAAERLRSKEAKGRFVFDTLSELAARTQPPVLSTLDAAGAVARPFWIVNMVWARGDLQLIERLARMSEVARIDADSRLSREQVRIDTVAPTGVAAVAGIEWNIRKVNAPAVWAAGVIGDGAVVAGMDTGYQWDHPALIRQYRGWSPKGVRHDYSWHDAIHAGGDFECPSDSPQPCDSQGHGTHTMGTVVGDDGLSNQIGVAPGARWIGCRCWEPVRRTAVSYVTECFQWFVAPTDMGGANPDPGMAPHAITNSWVCEPDEGCKDLNVLRPVVENVRAAGIVVVGGAGNDGPGCTTVFYPPAIYEATFSVGATTDADWIAAFSSRGPVLSDGSGRLKPDITAPGQNVRSAVPGGGFQGGWNGTSMATPHVTGAVALLVSAVPSLAGHVDIIQDILIRTAVPLTSGEDCGDVSGSSVPNNTFGNGRLDVLAAYEYAVSLTSVEDALPDEVATRSVRRWHLFPNVPNPFNPTTRIEYEVAAQVPVTLRVYDVAGRLVRELVARRRPEPGKHVVVWDGRDDAGRAVPSGVYVYRLRSRLDVRSLSMTLVR